MCNSLGGKLPQLTLPFHFRKMDKVELSDGVINLDD